MNYQMGPGLAYVAHNNNKQLHQPAPRKPFPTPRTCSRTTRWRRSSYTTTGLVPSELQGMEMRRLPT